MKKIYIDTQIYKIVHDKIHDIKMMIPDIKMILLINVLRSARPNTVL